MPPRTRRPAAKADPGDEHLADQVEAAEAALCTECWPAGWPDEVYSAGCEHGSYLHHERAAAIRT